MLLLFLFSLFITVSSQPSADQTGMPTQCQSGQYVTLNHPTRRTSYYGSNSKCDYRDFTLSVWYYFGGDTGYGYIITSPVTNINWAGNWAATVPCDTQAPGWYAGVMPTSRGQTTSGQVKYSWFGSESYQSDISVTQCNGFYVYRPTMVRNWCQNSMCTTNVPPAGFIPFICAVGSYCITQGNLTIPCPAGTFGSSTVNQNSSCSGQCLAGYFGATSGLSTANCTGACPAGSFSSAGATACTLCPPGRYSLTTRSTTCLLCGIGFFNSISGLSTMCTSITNKVSAGYFRGVGSPTAQGVPCPAGRFSSLSNVTACTNCDSGYYGLGGSSSFSCSGRCVATFGYYCDVGASVSYGYPCPNNTYNSNAGGVSAKSCLPCSVNSYSSGSSSSCGSCLSGIFTFFNLSRILGSVALSSSSVLLSGSRYLMGAAAAGTIAMFAGGFGSTELRSVDVFNFATGLWSTYAAGLSTARSSVTGASVGMKILFAGGGVSTVVDLFDTVLSVWKSYPFGLSVGRRDVAACSVLNSVLLFTGGLSYSSRSSNVIDIYNDTSGIMFASPVGLTISRWSHCATSSPIFGYFAGGTTSIPIVDVYNSVFQSWSTMSLSAARSSLACTSVFGLSLFAGGLLWVGNTSTVATNVVDILDSGSGVWRTASLSSSRYGLTAVTLGCRVLFAGGVNSLSSYVSLIDIFDSSLNLWRTMALSSNSYQGAAVAVGNTAIFAIGNSGVSPVSTVNFVSFCASGSYSTVNGVCSCPSGQFGTGTSCSNCTAGTYSIAGSSVCSTCLGGSVGVSVSGNVSVSRSLLAGAASGAVAVFAGGLSTVALNRADIFNSATNTWTTSSLSVSRYSLASAFVGTNILFFGGYTGVVYSRVVDLFDVVTLQFSSVSTGLSVGRSQLACFSVFGVLVFCGGGTNGSPLNTIDVYNSSSNTFSVSGTTLSVARYGLSAVSTTSLGLFVGGIGSGYSNVVNIYNGLYGIWSTSTISVARSGISSVSMGSVLLFAGGFTGSYSSVVDIYNSLVNVWSTASLSLARSMIAGSSIGCKALFVGGLSTTSQSRVDIYDLQFNSWSSISLSVAVDSSVALSINSLLFVAGGATDGVVKNAVSYFGLCSSSNSVIIDYKCTCPSGRYNNGTSCLLCPVGYFGSTPGLTVHSCSGKCVAAAGTYCVAGMTSATSSTPCSVGKYSSVIGSTVCLSCVSGSYSVDVGSTSCALCSSLFFSSSTSVDLTFPMSSPVSALSGNYAFFANGSVGMLFNSITSTWSTTAFTGNRKLFASVGVGNKILVLGGLNTSTNNVINLVDIFDSITLRWSSSMLSTARHSAVGITLLNSIAIVAGGSSVSAALSNVDIYNVSAGLFSVSSVGLSVSRFSHAGVSSGVFALFAGGYTGSVTSNRVDIYNVNLNSWFTSVLSVSRCYMASSSVGPVILFVGGSVSLPVSVGSVSNVVDLYNTLTGVWTSSSISVARSNLYALSVGCKVVIVGGTNSLQQFNVIDIYDASNSSWSVATLLTGTSNMVGVTIGSVALFVGGDVSSLSVTYIGFCNRDGLSVSSTLRCGCPAGTYDTGVLCRNCVASQSCPFGSTSPSFCPIGYYCPVGVALPCPAGTYGSSLNGNGLYSCLNCSSGYYGSLSGQSSCSELCPVGFFCPSGVSRALVCPSGFYCPTGSSVPSACSAGFYGNVSGLSNSSCSGICPAGSYCPSGSVSPVSCILGGYCPSGSAFPFPCPAGKFGNMTGLSNSSCSGNCNVNAFCKEGSVSPLGVADTTSSLTCNTLEANINTNITCTYISRVSNVVTMISPFQLNITLAKSDRQQYRMVDGESVFVFPLDAPVIDFWVLNGFVKYSPFAISADNLSATFTLVFYPVGDVYKVSLNGVCSEVLYAFDLVDSVEVAGSVVVM